MQTFLLTLLGNIVIAIGILLTIFITKKILEQAIKYLNFVIALTVGLLLGIIFLGFLPKVTSHLQGESIGIWILSGLFLFYLLEVFLHWHHCKDLKHKCHQPENLHKSGFLIFGGTLLHNAFHGIVLFSAFSVSISFGIATTLAILLHSIPQNVVNYIMNHKQIKFAYLAAIGGIIGALLTYPFKDFLLQQKFIILAIISGGLLYTALADIFPDIKDKGQIKDKIIYVALIILGILLFVGIEYLSTLLKP